MKKNEIYVYKLGTKEDIQQELRQRCRGFANNITDYIDSELQKVDKTLFNQWAENQLLKNTIDKAIEYIENECLDENKLYCHDLVGNDIYEVLNILKGSDIDEGK